MNISVLISVYSKESPQFLDEALQSIAEQTRVPDEVVLIKDGPLSAELDEVIYAYERRLPMRVVSLPRNVGLGAALRDGLLQCRGDLIARMDSDDICVPDRFQKQIEYFEQHPETDALGGAIAEFDYDHTKPHSVRKLSCDPVELSVVAQRRNPLNHMTVMFRRDSVLNAGNYQEWNGFEDYHLWARLLLAGGRIRNLEDTLVLVRVGNGMASRRGGVTYLRQELKLQMLFRRMGFITPSRCIANMMIRIPVRVVPPNVRGALYKHLLRD